MGYTDLVGELANTAVRTAGGTSPGQLGFDVFSTIPDYLIKVVGSGVGAINMHTGNTDFSVSTGDHAPVFQSAINALRTNGGRIEFKGSVNWQTQVTLYPQIGLVGQGPLVAFQPNPTVINSSFNGSALLIVLDPGQLQRSFSWISNFTMVGLLAKTSQNLIEYNDSNGNMLDAYVDHVLLFQAGQHGIFHNSGQKIWVNGIYLEDNGVDGLRLANGTMRLGDAYIYNNGQSGTGWGIDATSAVNLTLSDSHLWSNASGGALVWSNSGAMVFKGNNFQNNGAATSANQITIHDNSGTANSACVISGNYFMDSRGASAVNNHIKGTTGGISHAAITGNRFVGSQQNAVAVTALTGNDYVIKDNLGFNNTVGKLANPFSTTQLRMGIEGTVAAPTASSTYVVGCTDLFVNIAGQTGGGITINEPGGTTVFSGSTSYSGILPIGYTINFGAFTVAPTTMIACVM